MKKILILLLVFVLVLSSSVLGCGSKSNSNDFDKLSSMSWDKVIEKAKEEGEVSWFVWYFQPKYREIAEDFTNKYGIKVTIPEGTRDGNQNKVIADKSKPAGDIDVIAFPSSEIIANTDGLLAGPLDFIPGSEDRTDVLAASDMEGRAWAWWGNQTGFAYDPKKISESELPQSFSEFEKWISANPKKFAFNDTTSGTAGVAFVQAVIQNVGPKIDYASTAFSDDVVAKWSVVWDWFNAHKDHYGLTASNADSITRLSDGEFTIVTAYEDHLGNLQGQGAVSKDLKFYIPKFGMYGDGNFAGIPLNAPHPAAAALFMEWLTSAETQTKMNEVFGAVPKNAKSKTPRSLLSNEEQRKNATLAMPFEYVAASKKAFLEKVLLQ